MWSKIFQFVYIDVRNNINYLNRKFVLCVILVYFGHQCIRQPIKCMSICPTSYSTISLSFIFEPVLEKFFDMCRCHIVACQYSSIALWYHNGQPSYWCPPTHVSTTSYNLAVIKIMQAARLAMFASWIWFDYRWGEALKWLSRNLFFCLHKAFLRKMTVNYVHVIIHGKLLQISQIWRTTIWVPKKIYSE